MQNSRQRPWEKSNTLPHKLGGGSNTSSNQILNSQGPISNTVSTSGSESPRPIRKRFASACEETILKVNFQSIVKIFFFLNFDFSFIFSSSH